MKKTKGELRVIEASRAMPSMVDALLSVQSTYTRIQIRVTHLGKVGRVDPEANALLEKIAPVAEYLIGRIATFIVTHPAYSWAIRVKGVGKENLAKIVGLVRVKPSHEFVCVNRECRLSVDKDGRTVPPECPGCGEQMKDPGWADTISALWKFTGVDVDSEGKTPKRVKGQKSSYNARLRTMCWRVGSSILKAGLRSRCSVCGDLLGAEAVTKHECAGAKYKSIGTSKFAALYVTSKKFYEEKAAFEGKKIVPAEQLPKRDGKHYEPPDMISEGHIHQRAMRKMIKIFLGCLWLAWREAEGLPVTLPYAIDKLHHESLMSPEDMVDR